jgi:hypothetical protein
MKKAGRPSNGGIHVLSGLAGTKTSLKKTFDRLTAEARKTAKKAGLKPSDVTDAIAKARGRRGVQK